MGRRVCAALAAVLGCSCATGQHAGAGVDSAGAGSDAAPSSVFDAPAGPDAAPAFALHVEPEVTWTAGQAPAVLGAAGNRICFLTASSGAFDSGSEVKVYPSAGSWYVAGTGSVSASARCLTWTNASLVIGGPYSWLQGQAPVVLTGEANALCGLTRMGGQFRGGGELVRTYVEAGTWKLGGSSQQTGVGANAQCLAWTSTIALAVQPEVAWAQGQPAQDLGSGNRACVLTQISGSYRGYGERVAIQQAGAWQLTGASQQAGVAAHARCLAY